MQLTFENILVKKKERERHKSNYEWFLCVCKLKEKKVFLGRIKVAHNKNKY